MYNFLELSQYLKRNKIGKNNSKSIKQIAITKQ